MKMLKLNSYNGATLIFFMVILLTAPACRKGNASGNGTTGTSIKITDAPIDDAGVTGAFVTVTDIKLDGQSLQSFTKTTINLQAYQNGATQLLGNFNLQSKTYHSISFVLDFDMDANGNSPGCYVLTAGSVKHKLQSNANSISISKDFTIGGSSSNSIVADFDLRKMIIHQSGADHFDFATAAELESSVRVIAENGSGTISGTLTDNISGSGKVIAFVYKKGTFDRSTEMQGQGTSGITFKNAVSSSLVSGSGSYEFHFLESGDYEVHFVSYKDTNADGEYELNGTLIVSAGSGLDILGLTLNSGTNLSVNAMVTGVLP